MAESIRDKVAVVGVGACQFGENWDQSREDMIVDAAYEAYADAGIEDPQRQIEAVFAGAVYPREGTAEIAEALPGGTPAEAVERLMALAHAHGAPDNIAIVVADVP